MHLIDQASYVRTKLKFSHYSKTTLRLRLYATASCRKRRCYSVDSYLRLLCEVASDKQQKYLVNVLHRPHRKQRSTARSTRSLTWSCRIGSPAIPHGRHRPEPAAVASPRCTPSTLRRNYRCQSPRYTSAAPRWLFFLAIPHHESLVSASLSQKQTTTAAAVAAAAAAGGTERNMSAHGSSVYDVWGPIPSLDRDMPRFM